MASGTVQTGLIERVKIDDGTHQRIASTAYGECSTAAATAAKVVQIDGFELVTGVTIHVKFTHDNTASSAPTLNVNGTGAIYIVQYNNVAAGVTSETDGWQAGAVLSLTYDGTYWVRDSGYNTNTTYSNVSTSTAGLVPLAPNDTTKFLRGDANWAILPEASASAAGIMKLGATDGAATYEHGHGNITNDGKMSGSTITVGAAVTTSHKFLREDGTWVVPKYTSNTNNATRQRVSTTDANYSLLFSAVVIGTADNTTSYSTYRNDSIYANPSTGTIYATKFNDLTLTKEDVGFTIAGGTTSKTLTVGNSYTLGAACEKGIITDFTNNTTSTNLPTVAAVVSYVSGLGYTTNTGTVTSITINTSSPLTGGSNTAATTTGTWTIGFAAQSANTVLAGPASGNDATPTFRSLAAADLPTVTVAKGGTNKTSWTQYAIPYLSATTTFDEIAPNKTTTTKFLSMTGSGTAGDTPEWVTLSADDIPNISWNKITSGTPTTLEGYGITDAATDDHVHGNIGNDGTLGGNNIANRLVYTDSNQLIDVTGHYASSSKVAINSTSEPNENFYVNGTIQFNIGTNDGTSQERFIIYGNSRYLSLGGQGIQAYASSNTATLYLQSNGGNLIIGSSSTGSATRTMYGKFDFKSGTGFTYSGMSTASNSLNIYRPLWIMGASTSSNLTIGYPVYNTNLAFNASTNTLKIGTGTLSATDYSGTAAKATADADGNTITTTYAPLASPALTGTPTAPTAANNTNDTQIATTAFVYNTLNVANAMLFKGTIGANGTINTTADPAETLPTTHEAGWTYKVITAGTYAGMVCEVGDLIICVEDGTQDSNSDWTSVQVNDEGLVVGPASATDNAIARFDGTTGKVIQNSKISIDDNGKIEALHTKNKTDGIHFTYGSNINFFVGVGSGNANHGIYDTNASKWVLSATASNHNWTLNGNAATATQWASAQTVYVTLGTASTATTIQGGSSSAQTIGVDGTLAVTNGGTGTATAPTQGGLIYGSSTTAYACTSAGTSGQVIISKGTDTPEWYTGLTLLSTTTESNDTSITTYEAIFGGTVTATTYYGALEQRSSTDNVARSVWFSYYDNNTVQDGVLAKDSDFTYNPSTNVLSIGTLTITGGTANSALSSTGELSISSGTNKIMSINSGSTLTLDSATNTAIVFSKNDTAAWRFTADGTAIQPETSGAINLGSTTNRWGALYVGSSNDYGDEYTPVYWNNGVPSISYPVQYFTWTINASKKGVILTHTALTEDTFPLAIVVTSGEEYLTGPITWNNAKNGDNNQFKLTIPTALSASQSVNGYCIVAHGNTITPTSTDVS